MDARLKRSHTNRPDNHCKLSRLTSIVRVMATELANRNEVSIGSFRRIMLRFCDLALASHRAILVQSVQSPV